MIIGIVRDDGPELILKKFIIQIIDDIVTGQMKWDECTKEFIKEYITLVLNVGLEEFLKEKK